MARQFEEIIADFDVLKSNDYDFELGNFDGQERVRELCEELLKTSQPELAIPTLFKVFECMPDDDFGAPGALVHTLEKLGGYESELVVSMRRKPTASTVWMVNRIINGLRRKSTATEQIMLWKALLLQASIHPLANDAARENSLEYLQRAQ